MTRREAKGGKGRKQGIEEGNGGFSRAAYPYPDRIPVGQDPCGKGSIGRSEWQY
ncbi:MAG: hypothetical protein MUP04_03610 [Anaerolineae bacterium]|nr:hypothetical protein [Anaerolineae bacterium]